MIPILTGKRAVLRGSTWADFPDFARMWLEPEVARHIPFAPVAEKCGYDHLREDTDSDGDVRYMQRTRR